MKIPAPTLAVCVFLFLSQHAYAGNTSVTCTENGEIVYQDTIKGPPTAEQKLFLYKKYKNAMCMFMGEETQAPNAGSKTNILSQKIPDEIINGGTAGGDLAAALARISSGDTGTPYPIDITKEVANFKQESTENDAKPYVAHTINLTIGIYKSVSAGDVIAHWKEMQANGKSLKNLTPTLTSVKDVTMLSLENIPDDQAENVCRDAEKIGIGCVAYY